jgi:hypothetical protein
MVYSLSLSLHGLISFAYLHLRKFGHVNQCLFRLVVWLVQCVELDIIIMFYIVLGVKFSEYTGCLSIMVK